MNSLRFFSFFFLGMLLWSACGSDPVYVPKPRAYPKVMFPKRAYQTFEKDYCQCSFKYPVYSEVVKDTLFFNQKPVNDCWFDLVIPQFNARIHCSYYPISADSPLDKLRDDAFKMASKHAAKATFMEERKLKNEHDVSGFVFNIEGPAASPFQFFLTDEDKHFLRGSLYFNNTPEPDSLAPIIDFVKYDITQMIQTFEWTD
ncbi:MAG: hypothetical protein AAFV95_02900 [Bacteroidota bacterium]